MSRREYFVYILSNYKNGVLYVGVTNDLKRRVIEHKQSLIKGFTSDYRIDRLVYYEVTKYINNAITREKQIKEWKRRWKVELIEQENPDWKDLYLEL